MLDKPTVLMEGWQVFLLHGRPYYLVGFASGHPLLPGHRRRIRTSRVLSMSSDVRQAETLNTLYELRYPIKDMVFDEYYPMRIEISDLVATRAASGGDWCIRRGAVDLSNTVPDHETAILCMLAILDEIAD